MTTTRTLSRHATPYLIEAGEREACSACHGELIGWSSTAQYPRGRWLHLWAEAQYDVIGLHTAFPLSRDLDAA